MCPAKYRRVVFTPEVDQKLKETCLEIGKRYEIAFIEIGTDEDHVHILVQSVPTYSPKKSVQIIFGFDLLDGSGSLGREIVSIAHKSSSDWLVFTGTCVK